MQKHRTRAARAIAPRPAAAAPSPGFTLVELLVVIAIISVLAGLLLPALEEALDAARKTLCLNQQRQVAMSALQYTDENESFLPYLELAYGTSNSEDHYLYNTATWRAARLCPDWNHQGPNGLGHLYTAGYLDWSQLSMLMCPDFEIDDAPDPHRIQSGWNAINAGADTMGPGEVHIWCGFTYQYRDKCRWADSGRIDSPRLRAHPQVIACAFAGRQWAGGTVFTYLAKGDVGGKAHRFAGVNTTFLDGHGAWYRFEEFIPKLPSYNGKYQGTYSPNQNFWQNWDGAK